MRLRAHLGPRQVLQFFSQLLWEITDGSLVHILNNLQTPMWLLLVSSEGMSVHRNRSAVSKYPKTHYAKPNSDRVKNINGMMKKSI